VLIAAAATTRHAAASADAAPGKTWTDADLVAAYKDLSSQGGLDAAIRKPTRPKDPPQPAFLAALAWFAAQTPEQSGTLTLAQLDEFLDTQVSAYRDLLTAKAVRGESNDYPRTRTWKVIQKLTLLREEMLRPPNNGRYSFVRMPRASSAADSWEQAHTLTSVEAFTEKVCKGSATKPVLVKFGNTNCTQCMLFELTGAVKRYAESGNHAGSVDVYKVWWGFKPDGSFAGRIRDPQRLDDLAKAEGVQSSPYFIAYRNGRQYRCGDAFPGTDGSEPQLDACIARNAADAPLAPACAGAGVSQ
jgi:hypothetical protein